MRWLTRAIFLGSCLILCACSTTPTTTPDIGVRLTTVQGEIQRQLWVYEQIIREIRQHKFPDSAATSGAVVCQGGNLLDFDVKSVQLDLATTLDDTTSGTASAPIPIAPLVVTPSGSISKETQNTQELIYNEWLVPYADAPKAQQNAVLGAADLKNAPIAGFLLSVRSGLLSAVRAAPVGNTANTQPSAETCLVPFDPDTPSADPKDSYKTGLSVIGIHGGGVSIGIAPLTIGATTTAKNTIQNTITVSFAATDIPYGVKRCTKLEHLYCFSDGTTQVTNWAFGQSLIGAIETQGNGTLTQVPSPPGPAQTPKK